jgi:hypothetical protein
MAMNRFTIACSEEVQVLTFKASDQRESAKAILGCGRAFPQKWQR